MKAGDHLFLVDGSAYIFRAYHALPPLTRKSDGLPVGAVSGFCNMMWKLLQDARDTSVGVTPTHFAVIFDYSSKTFRNEIYPQYKANRPEPPEDLRPQFAVIRDATRAFNVPCIEMKDFEADDLIATYARVAREAGGDVTIISSDKDLMQLVGPNVILYDQMKDKRVGIAEVVEKWGVPPEKMIDLQALTGDSTDNVPGVPGIGPKTAAQLLEEFGDLDTLLSRTAEIKQVKRRESLESNTEQALVSRQLVTLRDDVPLETPLDDLVMEPVNGSRLVSFLKAMEFTTLTRRVAEATGTDAAQIEADIVSVNGFGSMRGPDLDPVDGSARTAGVAASGNSAEGASRDSASPHALAQKRIGEAVTQKIDRGAYESVRDTAALERWIAAIREKGTVAVDTETTSLDPMQAELVGVSLATGPGEACYIPISHKSGNDDLLGGGLVEQQLGEDHVLGLLRDVLEDPSILKIGQNMKYDWLVLAERGVEISPFDDTMLMSYVLDAGTNSHGMDELSRRWLGHEPISYKSLTGSGKSLVTFDMVDIAKATEYAAEDADVTFRLWKILKARLVASGMVSVYERLERPLVDVLARMEQRGVSVDRQILSRLSGELAQAAMGLEAEIYELAGEKFNIGSPKQLGDILFGKMNLPGASKTKTGQWSTSAQVLEDLAGEGHDLPRKIVFWRQLTKLKSTYTDALPQYVHPRTKRVHTSYAMASTSTGRLSSSEPNLQNIPVRTEEGRRIRTAFVAEKGNRLISADYSQIELRVLAHIADIPQLRQAFADGLDIHAMTASEMFNTPIEGMDPMVRRRAKAINFGIIYGISAFGLANQLSIPREEASNYIKTYFERFPGIRDYMEDTKRFVRDKGYVQTIFGRRAHYPEITSPNPQVRAFNERAAINAPIQGSAADIIRRAMTRMEDALHSHGLSARMLLQVHDELIFETAEEEVEATLPVISRVMIEAPLPAISLGVPLQVDARAAMNWDEAH
ncbi:MAG: DNA polymerase I [Rhizobiaceae bacterium]